MSLPPSVEGIISIPSIAGIQESVEYYSSTSISYPMIFNQDSSILYGMCARGGNYNTGCIYSINKINGNLSILYSLNYNTGYYGSNDTVYPLIFNGDYTTLYGITLRGGYNDISNNIQYQYGVLFSFNILTNTYTILNYCNRTVYGQFISQLVLSNDGNKLYGMSNNCPFQFNLTTKIISPLFNGYINSYSTFPYGNGKVNLTSRGNNPNYGGIQFTLNQQYLVGYCYKDYNKTVYDGSNYSYIYTIDLSNSDIFNNYNAIYTFDGSNNVLSGVNAISVPVIGADGKMYGFTQTGGTNNLGTFYSLDLSGNLNVLYHFNNITGGIYNFLLNGNSVVPYLSYDKKKFYGSAYQNNNFFSIDISGNFQLISNVNGNTYFNVTLPDNTTQQVFFRNRIMTLDTQNTFYFNVLINNGSSTYNENSYFMKYYLQDISLNLWNLNPIQIYNKTTQPYGFFQSNYNTPIISTPDNKQMFFITNNSLVSVNTYGNGSNMNVLYSFVSSGLIPTSIVYNYSNNTIYGTTYNGGFSSNGGTLYSYNLTTNTYTFLNSITNNPINMILDSTNIIIYILDSKNIWKYEITTENLRKIYTDNNSSHIYSNQLSLTKDGSKLYCIYIENTNNLYILSLSLNTFQFTANKVLSNSVAISTFYGVTLSADELSLYYTVKINSFNTYIYSFNILTSVVTQESLININAQNYYAVSGTILGGNKNNDHLLYGTVMNYLGNLFYLYSYDISTKVYTMVYHYGGTLDTQSISFNANAVPENGGVPFGVIVYALKDTIYSATVGGGTSYLGAVVKIRIHYREAPCFLEGTKILCLDQDCMVYIPIQHIRKGMKVKTLKHGFVPVNMIGVSEIENEGDARIMNRLYRLKQEQYPDLFDDLVITGCHSILVDQLSNTQILETLQKFDMVFMTDDKYRLLACLDEKTQPYEKSGKFTIYHLALDHENYFMNYGIYANGLLVESCSQRYIKELSGMRLIE